MRRAGRTITFWRVVSDEQGNRYLDVSSDEAADAGWSLLVPLVVAKGEPKSATSSVANAKSAVATPTASDLREVLCEADAVLLDSSTERTSAMKAGSSSRVRGSKSCSSSGTGSNWNSLRVMCLLMAANVVMMILAVANFATIQNPIADTFLAFASSLVLGFQLGTFLRIRRDAKRGEGE